MIDIKNFIIEKIKETNPNADVRTGSVFKDLVVNPLSSIIAGYQQEHDAFLQREAVTDLTSLAESELDAVAANFLIERTAGSNSVGNVKLYFSEPRAISFPAGTIFSTSTGLEFQTLATFSLSKFQMEQNITEFPNYDTGNIPLRAVLPGIAHNIPNGTILTFFSSVNITPVRIIATAGFTGGTAHESNNTLFRRLKDTVHNKSLASAYAIKAKIQDNYDNVIDVKVVGAGHPLMIRDLTTLTSDITSYLSEDFYLVYSGQHSELYDKSHEAYLGFFNDPLSGSLPTAPAISGWLDELTTVQYQNIYKSADAQYLEINDQPLINEVFTELIDADNPQAALQLIIDSNKWYVNDGANPTNEVFYINEINVEGGRLRLGKYLDPDAEDKLMQIPYSQLAVLNDLATSRLPGTTEQLEIQISGMVSAEQYNNTAPIFHRELSEHTGIRIQFTFETTDDTVNGEMAYATVYRNSEIFQPQDGYGLAFRKQPDYLIRMGAETHTDADITKFAEEYGVTEAVAATKVGSTLLNDSTLWKYNVYLVDNDVLQEEVWVGGEQLWDQTSGKNQFIQAGKAWIENDKTYQVRMNIYSNLATEAWVYDSASPPAQPYSAANRIINRGATVPSYVPISSALITTEIDGRDNILSYRNRFGLAVAQTRNNEWYFDDLTITSFASKSPMHLFRFKASDTEIASDSAFETNYYGVGYDPVKYALDGNTGHSKTLAQVWNENTQLWENIDTHTYTIADTRANQLLTKQFTPLGNYTDAEGFINIAALAYNFGASYPNDTNHGLRSFYVEMNNITPDTVHRGNAMDIYVQDPDNIIKGATAQVMTSSTLLVHNMPNIPGYIHEILEVREGISKVAYDTTSYTITNPAAGDSYSADAQYSIAFDLGDMTGTLIEVVYRYWSTGTAIATLLTQDDVRFPLADNKVKVMPPTVMNITNLIYSGGLPVEDMKLAIAEYINNLTTIQFDKSDLINHMYDLGANYVDTDIKITIREYDTEATRTSRKMTDSRYTIRTDTVSHFYTNVEELSGVVQI